MKPIEQISADLFEKLRARSADINIGDEEANDTVDPEEARFFNFDYKQRGKSFGNVTITIAGKKGLKVFYSKNITDNTELDERHWFSFLRGLRKFAMRNLLTFDARDINKDSLALRDIKTFAATMGSEVTTKGISESKLYGSTKSSYQKLGPVKLIVKHSAQVDEAVHGARSRNIEKIFIETSDGERFKLESSSLLAGRVIARHVSNGGAHNDAFAKHVNESINELKDLRYFVLSSKKRQFEDATTTQMVESAVQYYNSLRETLHRLKGQRGYAKYMESFQESTASEQLDEMTEDLKERFIQKYFDQRMEQAIPHIAKAYAATIREAAQVAKQIEQFETGSSRFGLNESDRDMLGLLEFTDKNAFMIKMLENISVKLAESDKVIAKFARHVMENWDSANKTNREMAGKLVRSYVKEIKDIVKKNHSIVEQDVAEAAKWRTHTDAHDLDTDGSYIPKGGIKSDNLAIRQTASKTQSEKDPKSMAGMFGAKYAKKHGVPTKQLMKNIPLGEEQGVTEEEQINELSKDTLKSYAKKAVPDMHASQKKAEVEHLKAASAKTDRAAKKHYDAATQAKDRVEKRMAGVAGAIRSFNKKGVTEAGLRFNGGFPDVDHMNGPRGIGLPSAPTKKFFTDKQKWSQTVDDINHSKYDDNSEYTGMTGRSTVSIDGREWARWSDAQQKGYIELSSMSEQGVTEGRVASPVSRAITHRILDQRQDLLKFGPQAVMDAVEQVAEWVGEVEEIGSSDISAWVAQVARHLQTQDEQGVAEGLNEFARGDFNGGDDDDDDEGFSPAIAKMAQEDGFTKGAELADGATLERAITINHWHATFGGMYKQYFAKGFKAGRLDKINFNNKQYNLNLQLMNDGSIRHGGQGVAEGSKEKTQGIALSKAYKKDFDDNKPGQDRAETALTGTYSKTGKPGGELKKKGVAEAATTEWHGSNTDPEWYNGYKNNPVRVKVKKNISGFGGQPSGTYTVRSFTKVAPDDAEFTIIVLGREMTASLDLDNPPTYVDKNYDTKYAYDFYSGTMPITPRQAFNLIQVKKQPDNSKQGVAEGNKEQGGNYYGFHKGQKVYVFINPENEQQTPSEHPAPKFTVATIKTLYNADDADLRGSNGKMLYAIPQSHMLTPKEMAKIKSAKGVAEGKKPTQSLWTTDPALKRIVKFATSKGYTVKFSKSGETARFVNKAINHWVKAQHYDRAPNLSVNFENNSGERGHDYASEFLDTFLYFHEEATELHKEGWGEESQQGVAEASNRMQKYGQLIIKRARQAKREAEAAEKAKRDAEQEKTEKEKKKGVAEAQLNEGTWVMPLKEKQTIDFIELMSKPLEVGADADSATNALDGLFGDDELFDALANKSDTSISYDARPMVLNRLLQVVAHPQYIKADDVELTNLAKMLTQLKTTDAGKEYASKIDLILEKYPKQPEEDKPEADRAAPTLQPPAA